MGLADGVFLPPTMDEIYACAAAASAGTVSAAGQPHVGAVSGPHSDASADMQRSDVAVGQLRSDVAVNTQRSGTAVGQAHSDTGAADGPRLGAAAMAFVVRELPLFDVPWHVKLSLEAAGVRSARVVCPDVRLGCG